ncbi:MAG: MOSC domain-containing protein [Polaribacter sp.]|nr:MOSC domain-containing protein [Polaribacter sp.]
MKIVATNIGDRIDVNWKGKLITTGIFKYAVEKPIFLDIEEVKGDVICDRKHHGGIDQAVYGYSEKHYPYFKKLHPTLDWSFGMFGENLTIDDLDETQIHVGDIFKVGETILEVTKPRQPCKTLGVRFDTMKIVKQFWNSTMSGVYFKVLQTGFVKVGDVLKQVKSCPDNPTIAAVYGEKRIEKKGG